MKRDREDEKGVEREKEEMGGRGEGINDRIKTLERVCV